MKRFFATAILFLATFSLAQAAATDPKDVVQDIFAKVSDPAIAQDAQKQAVVTQQVNFEALAKAALGKHASKVSEKDFAWFQNTLKQIITLTIYPKAPDFLKGVKISYDGVDAKENKAEVRSTVQNKADLTEVNYTLGKSGDSWKVTDITLSGNRWSEIISDEVTNVLQKKGWKGLETAMNKRLNELKKE